MANLLYPKYKELLLGAGLDLTSGSVKAALVDSGAYTYSSAHDFYNDVSAGVVGTPVALTTKTVTNGVFDADDVTFTSVSGAQCEYILLYVDTGVAGTSPLIALIDTATGLPVTPSGGNIVITWNASGIFTL